MKKKLKVTKAISIGRSMVIFPLAILIFVIFGALFYFVIQKRLPYWILSIGFFLSFVAGWFCWRFMVAWWKSWAFLNVKNVDQLKKRVSQDNLLWPSVGFFTKNLPKFNKPGELVLNEVSEIPKEIIIYYSRSKNLIEMGNGLFLILIAFFLIFKTMSEEFHLSIYVVIFFALIGGTILAYTEYKEATNIEVQIVINNRGIWTIKSGFKDWKDIENEEVYTEKGEKHTKNYLAYYYVGGSEYLQIDDYNIQPRQLETLLQVYRERHNAKK